MGQDPGEVRHEVEEAREQLGDTVEAIAYKANAPRRARDRAAETLSDARQRLSSDPRAEKVRSGARTLKDAAQRTSANHGLSSGGAGRSLQERAEPVIARVRAVPPRLAAGVGAGVVAGYVIGRRRGRRRGY